MLIYAQFVARILVLVAHVPFGSDMDVHLLHFDAILGNIRNVHVFIECALVRVCLHEKFAIKKWSHVYDKFVLNVCRRRHQQCVPFTIQWLNESLKHFLCLLAIRAVPIFMVHRVLQQVLYTLDSVMYLERIHPSNLRC
jgi:hypothetical protein